MLAALIDHVAREADLAPAKAVDAVGIVLNAADRQGAEMAARIFQNVAGARTLAACMGAETGAATGVIARLIEQTPGGQVNVAEDMIRSLQRAGLGHREIGALLPAMGSFADNSCGLWGSGHLGDVLGRRDAEDVDDDMSDEVETRSA